MKQITLSIILVTQGDPGRLAALVSELITAAARHVADYELIIVESSGAPGARAAADRLAAAHGPVLAIHHARPRGYAFALRDGWSVARGEYIFALDGGGPAAGAALGRLLPYIDEHAAVFGYRTPFPRDPRARAFAALARAACAGDMRDPALRMAIFRADLHELLADIPDDALAHAALYAAARRRDLPVAQVGVPGGASPSDTDLAALLRLMPRPPLGGQPRPQAGAAIGVAMLAAGGLWLLRRWLPGARHDRP